MRLVGDEVPENDEAGVAFQDGNIQQGHRLKSASVPRMASWNHSRRNFDADRP